MHLKRRFIAAVVVIAGLAGMVALPSFASALQYSPSPGGPLQVPGPDDALSSFAVGDFDGNGNDDVAAVTHANKLFVFLADNDGAGFTLDAGGPIDLGSSVFSREFAAAGDFGGDSAIDLLIGNAIEYETFLGDGDGGFSSTADSSFAVPGSVFWHGQSEAMADVNNDGKLDFIAAGEQHSLIVALGDGDADGSFSVTAGSPINVPTPENNGADGFNSTTVGDFNGDGKPDVAMTQQTNGIGGSDPGLYVAVGTGTGAFTALEANPIVEAGSGESFRSAAALDLNDDTFDDLTYLVNSYDLNVNETRSLVGSAAGLVANGNENSIAYAPIFSRPYDQAVADMDGDFFKDLVTARLQSESVGVDLNDGTGGLITAFTSPFHNPGINGAPFLARSILTGDFNGDGHPDIASFSGSPHTDTEARGVSVLISRPQPTFYAELLDFPVTQTGETSATQSLHIKNNGAPDTFAPTFSVEGDGAQFVVDDSDCDSAMAYGDECDVVVKFKPLSPGTYTAHLKVDFGDEEFPVYSVPLTGNTGTATATSNPTSGTFGQVVTNYTAGTATQTFAITAGGGNVLQLGAPEITGPDAQFYSVISNDCPAILVPPQGCSVTVKLAPTGTANGFVEGQLAFPDSNEADPLTISLGGFARQADFLFNPASQDFGKAVIANGIVRRAKAFTISASGSIGVPIDGVAINGPDADLFSITSNDCPPILALTSGCSIEVIFDPTTGSPGAKSATLDIDAFSSVKDPPSIPLTGTATAVEPKFSMKLKTPKKAKSGSSVIVIAVIKNNAPARSGPIVLTASGPAKITGKVKNIKSMPLGRGESITRKFRIPVKKSARGKFQVKIHLRSAGKTLLIQKTKMISVWGGTNKLL